MKATYVGNLDLPKGEREVPEEFQMFGLVFEKGKATEIPAEFEAKLAGNSHFEISGKEAK